MQERLFSLEQTVETSDDHYTPKWVFDKLDLVFDIDVASPPNGIPWIPTKKFFTQKDDGLNEVWHGTIWCNPPYSNTLPWVKKFIEHGDGVALLPIVNSRWFQSLMDNKQTKCVLGVETGRDRMAFIKNDSYHVIMFPVMFWAMGEKSINAIANLGNVR
jgi:hypothetical protein